MLGIWLIWGQSGTAILGRESLLCQIFVLLQLLGKIPFSVFSKNLKMSNRLFRESTF